MQDVESLHDDEIIEVVLADEEEKKERKEKEEPGGQKDEAGEKDGRKKFVCLEGEDHIVNEEGKCTLCEHKRLRVYQWCDSCHFYFFRKGVANARAHTHGVSHRHFASNPVVFDVRCKGCGRNSWTDFQIAKQKCSCCKALEKKCPECLEWFRFSTFANHFSAIHIRGNDASAVPNPHLNDKLDSPKRTREKAAEANAAKPVKKKEKKNNEKMAEKKEVVKEKFDPPKRTREKAAEANAAKPLKKKEKKNNEKVAEKKDAVKKKAVMKKADKKVENPNVAPAAPVRNAEFVDFVQSLRSQGTDAAVVSEVLKIVKDQILDREFFIECDDELFQELEQGRPIGVKSMLRKIRTICKK